MQAHSPLGPSPRLGHARRYPPGGRERRLPHAPRPRPHTRRTHRHPLVVPPLPAQQGHHIRICRRGGHANAPAPRHLARPDPDHHREPGRVRRARGRPARNGRRLRGRSRRPTQPDPRRPAHHRRVRRRRWPGRRLLDPPIGRDLHPRDPPRVPLGARGRPRLLHVRDCRPHLHRRHEACALL